MTFYDQSFSMTLQVWKISFLNFKTFHVFPGSVRTLKKAIKFLKNPLFHQKYSVVHKRAKIKTKN